MYLDFQRDTRFSFVYSCSSGCHYQSTDSAAMVCTASDCSSAVTSQDRLIGSFVQTNSNCTLNYKSIVSGVNKACQVKTLVEVAFEWWYDDRRIRFAIQCSVHQQLCFKIPRTRCFTDVEDLNLVENLLYCLDILHDLCCYAENYLCPGGSGHHDGGFCSQDYLPNYLSISDHADQMLIIHDYCSIDYFEVANNEGACPITVVESRIPNTASAISCVHDVGYPYVLYNFQSSTCCYFSGYCR